MMSGDESFYPRHGIGEPSDDDLRISALQDEVARLQQLVFDAQEDGRRLKGEVVGLVGLRERENCAAIVDGFALEAAYSGERHVIELIAKAIRARGLK